MDGDQHSPLEIIGRRECETLLAREHFGRIAVVVDGRPIILPVAYAWNGGEVVFRTGEGTKLHAAVDGPVAFEIDGRDVTYHSGWSVLVVGQAERVSDPDRLDELSRVGIPHWVHSAMPYWVAVRPDAITGRRIPAP